MAKRSETSRQKRARQNRAQRAALAARTSGEAVKRPSRVAPRVIVKLKTAPRTSTRAGELDPAEAPAADGNADRKARRTRERRPRPGDRPVDIETLEGSWFSKVIKVPGGMQVLMAVGMTIVVTGLLAFLDTFPSQADIDNDVDNPKPVRTIFEAMGTGRALLLLVIPLIIVGAAAGFSLHKHRRRIWMGAAFLLGAYFALGMLQYIFPMGFLFYACMRASRVEGPNEPLFRRNRGPADASGDEAAGDEAEGGEDPSDLDGDELDGEDEAVDGERVRAEGDA